MSYSRGHWSRSLESKARGRGGETAMNGEAKAGREEEHGCLTAWTVVVQTWCFCGGYRRCCNVREVVRGRKGTPHFLPLRGGKPERAVGHGCL